MASSEHAFPYQFRPGTGETTRAIAPDASRRVAGLVAIFRLTAALVLLMTSVAMLDAPLIGHRDPVLFRWVAAVYALLAAAFLLHQRSSPIPGPYRVAVLLAVDIVAITLLVHTGGGITGGVGGLLVVFVGAAALTLPGRHAFLAAALATLAVLAEQMLAFSQENASASDFMGAGLLGAVIFAIAAAAFPLARRLEESEALAHQRGVDLANLAQLNEYIVQNLRESIVVVDAANNVRLMNQPAAEQLGNRTRTPGQALARISPDLSRLLESWRHGGEARRQLPAFLSADGSMQINTYIAPLGDNEQGPVLIFLEDAGMLAEKVQQSKLAALGRLTASIAHEIRNPVGAMSHAGQLLEESPAVGADERRLLDIIRTNSRRVSDIVENILQLSRREASKPQLLSLRSWTEAFAKEFTSTMELADGQVTVIPGENLDVRMDPGHLHQILWNLCENALKYGSTSSSGDVTENAVTYASEAGSTIDIALGRMSASRRPFLEVADRGPGIPGTLAERVFEPFATGPTGGTGLGLFISRELCECNRAALLHEPRKGGGSIFRIVFADPARWGGEG